ncbi:MAG TPA: hypothetical protein VN154_10315, partial [Rhizomicrobium sp.]|nr:hypothetical protein [Rhizomicrobium sp.]
ETELVVIVSAYLVAPTSERKLASPTDGFANPSDVETIAEGKLNKVIKPQPQENKPDNKVGFIVE